MKQNALTWIVLLVVSLGVVMVGYYKFVHLTKPATEKGEILAGAAAVVASPYDGVYTSNISIETASKRFAYLKMESVAEGQMNAEISFHGIGEAPESLLACPGVRIAGNEAFVKCPTEKEGTLSLDGNFEKEGEQVFLVGTLLWTLNGQVIIERAVKLAHSQAQNAN